MPSALVTTVGAATANSYVDEAGFETYVDDRLNASATFAAADSDNVARALREAARDLDLMPWSGARATMTQNLAWPRSDVRDPDRDGINDGLTFDVLRKRLPIDYDADIIPQRVKDAQCELALEYLKAGAADLAVADPAAGIKREKVGPLETEYFSPGTRPTGVYRFPRVVQLVAPLLKSGRGGGALKVVRW